ncbi:MAG: hydroxymethylbilane synthase [Deltaproteobacteria bacterium]|nr:MAG: hydroxymethylbilane synthase [Deltaproteobacteria bacterium]
MTARRRIRIGTRGSDLALWQARHVAEALRAAHPGLEVELCEIVTSGDRDRTRPLSEIGGKGVFVREIERALLEGDVDLAVHSLKDLPARPPEGLVLLPTVARAPVEDVLVVREEMARTPLSDLPEGFAVGTGSLRRGALLRRHVPNAAPVPIRGNVPTRLAKVGETVDGVVLARAGLERLGIVPATARILPVDPFLPAPCQGLLGLEAREGDAFVAEKVAGIADAVATVAMTVERAFVARLGADCNVPVGALAEVFGDRVEARAMVVMPDGSRRVNATWSGPLERAAEGGRALAEVLLEAGGAEILADLAAPTA